MLFGVKRWKICVLLECRLVCGFRTKQRSVNFEILAIKEPKHVREFEHYKEPGPASNQYTHYNYTYKYEDLESKRTGTAGSTKRGIK